MSPERWQHIKEIFNRALACDASVRQKLIDELCAGDDDLRREVLSLLKAHEQTGSFLEQPAHEIAAEMLIAADVANAEDDAGAGALAGQSIEHYRVLKLIARGGMGEVYLAEDTRLGRQAVLKVLPERFTQDVDRVRRFEQEARAASALNHPNIVTIYEIGDVEQTRFIATEYIAGKTLRSRIKRNDLALTEILDVTMQVAAALTVAHEAGIVHRDIKPENIMLRADGYVKLLDFGIAKLNQPANENNETDPEALTRNLVHTAPHMVMGTVSYMSPEQARGQVIDARTDVWSLGIVLYEMIAGRVPFAGETPQDVIAAVLTRSPAALQQFAPDAPPELYRIIRRTLHKNRDERYQTIRDLYLDLKSLKQEIEFAQNEDSLSLRLPLTTGERALHHSLQTSPDALRTSNQHRLQVTNLVQDSAAHGTDANTTQRFRSFTSRRGLLVALALISLAAASIALYKFLPLNRSGGNQSITPKESIVSSLTNTGNAVRAAISPDGKFVAYVQQNANNQTLLVNRVATAGMATVMPAEAVNYLGLTFSQDGDYIYFVRAENSANGNLYQVPALGGAAKKLIDNVDSPIGLSPDGKQLTFVRVDQTQGVYKLIVANTDGTNERTLATRQNGERLSPDGAAFSPDGKSIICAAGDWTGGFNMYLLEFNLTNGSEKRLAMARRWFTIQQVAWINANSLITIAAEDPTSPAQIWKVSYPGGAMEKITRDLNDCVGISFSPATRTILSVQKNRVTNIWVAPNGDARRARQIASGVGLTYGLSWTRDGKIITSSMAGGKLNISLLSPDGIERKQLTVNSGDNYHPVTTADGRFIIFASSRGGTFNIWRMNAEDGSDARQLTNGGSDFYPYPTPDNKWVVFEHQSNGATTLWKIPFDGGEAVQVTDKYARLPVISPDGQFIACRYFIEPNRMGIAILRFDNGEPVNLLPIPIIENQRVRWMPDGRALTYMDVRDGAHNIWSQPRDGGKPVQLTDFNAERMFAYDWTADGKQLVCERGVELNDVVAISEN